MTAAIALALTLAAAPLSPVSVAVSGDQLQLPPGFRAELLHSVSLEKEGSWVAMTFDGRGRVIASSQNGPLFRITLRGAKPTVERIDAKVSGCQGLLWAQDSLYCVANTQDDAVKSGLYRLRDRDRDDRFESVELLREFLNDRRQPMKGMEHGPHGIVRGPDGGLYVAAGNNTATVEATPDSPYRNYAEDLLLPRRPDGRGHNTGVMAPGGWIARTDLDGKQWRLLAGGFRNHYDLAFNHHGELFTYDSDMEWDIGVSWYRPTRVNHVVSGAEYGWRFGTGKWPAYYADSVGAVVDLGMGSPTGVTFGHGAKFPAKYQRALYAFDWTYGRIHAVHLTPDGASYRATSETFIHGKPLPVTDGAVGPDGALYFVTGGRLTQSGLYRVVYTGKEPTAPVRDEDTADARRARSLRRRLEAFHGREDARAVALAWPHLGSADRALRYAARVAVEHQPRARWEARAFAEQRPLARTAAMIALTRNLTDPRAPIAEDARRAYVDRIAAALDQQPLDTLSDDAVLDVLRAYALAFARLGRPGAEAAARTLARLDPLYPDRRGRTFVNRELSQLLIHLEAPRIVPRSLELMGRAETQEDQVHFAFVLRNVKRGWTIPEMRTYFGWLNRATTTYKGGASWALFLEGIRADAVASFVDAASRKKLGNIVEAPVVDAPGSDTARAFVRDWQMEELEPALAQVSHGRSFEKGRMAMEAAQCLRCHRFYTEGGGAGPDLTQVGNRFTPRELLESILLPSKVISDQYQSALVVTKTGDVQTGAVVGETATELILRPSPLASDTVRIKKADIQSRGLSDVSLMPQGLASVLTRDDILDLLAYLRSGGRREDPAFRPEAPKRAQATPPRR